MEKNTILICKKVIFNSIPDQVCFIEWMKKIKSIVAVYGYGFELHLHVKSNIPDSDLLELISLYDRYKINMKSLKIFLNEKNKAWFKDKKRYWYGRIFKNNTTTRKTS